MEELVGTAEVAALLGVSERRVLQLLETYSDFPIPETLRGGRVWRREHVEFWLERHEDRQPGRPKYVGQTHLPQLGSLLSVYRKKAGLSLTDVARRSGTTVSEWRRIEEGKLADGQRPPTTKWVREIATLLGRHPGELLEAAGFLKEARAERSSFGKTNVKSAIADELRKGTASFHRRAKES